MRNIAKIFLLTMLSSFVLVSCLDDEKVDYGKGPIVVQFPSSAITNNFLQDGSNAVYDYKIPVEYKGGNGQPLSEEVTLKVAVSESSTAKDGVEYTIESTDVTIPAGESQGFIPVKVNSGKLDALNPKKLVLDIKESSQVVSNNKYQVAATLQAICPSALEGDYQYQGGKAKSVTVTKEGEGVYKVSGDNILTKDYYFSISDVCGNITVISSQVEKWGYPTSGTGTVNEDGTITLTYSIGGIFENRSMTMKKK